MKKIVWLIVIVAALLLGLPAVLGIFAERETYKQLELAQDNSLFSLKISEFDRGWFKSQVTYELGLSEGYLELLANATKADDAAPTENWQEIAAPLEMISQLSHGPIGFHSGLFFGLFRAETTNGPDNPRVNEFLQATNMPHLFLAKSTTSLFGKSTLSASIPPANVEAGELGSDTQLRSVEFSGMKFTGTHQSGSNKTTMDGGGQTFSLVADNVSMGMEGLSISADLESVSKTIAWGEVKTTVDSMSLFDATTDNPEPMLVKGVTAQMNTTKGAAPGTADVLARYLIDDISVAGQQANDIEFAFSMQAISVAALEKYTQWSQDVVIDAAQVADSEDSQAAEKLAAESMQVLQPLLHEFAKQSPTINVDPIKFTANGEAFQASFLMHLDGSKLPMLDAFDLADVPLWLSMASAKAGASISEGLATQIAISSARSQLVEALGDQQEISEQQISDMAAAQAPLVVETLVQQGLVKRSEGKLSALVSFEDGELLLNGQAMPLGALMGAMQ